MAALQDVANLLLIVYDDYVKGQEGNKVLQGLLLLLHDLNLTATVSILDAERLRLRVMRGAMGSKKATMSYESFYEWLRHVACLVFDKFGESGSRALNMLLTQHIIPMAIKGKEVSVVSTVKREVRTMIPITDQGKSTDSTTTSTTVDDQSLYVLNPYGDFLYLWFTSRNINEGIRLAPFKYLTYRVAQHKANSQSASLTKVSVENIFDTLKACKVFADSALENDMRFFAEMVQIASAPRDIPGLSSGLNHLAFPGFLAIFEAIAKKVQLNEVQMLGMGLTVATKLKVLLQTVSERLLEDTLKRFAVYEAEREASAVATSQGKYSRFYGSNRFGLPPASNQGSSLTGSSVLWLVRQAGMTQVPGLSLWQLLDELLSRSDASQLQSQQNPMSRWEVPVRSSSSSSSRSRTGGEDDGEQRHPPRFGESNGGMVQRVHAWSIANLAQSLGQIAEAHMRQTHPVRMDDTNSLTGVSWTGRAALQLAQYLPALFFAAPAHLPVLLQPLYSPAGIRELQSLSTELDIFFESMFFPSRTPDQIATATLAITNGNGNQNKPAVGSTREFGTFKEFERLCSISGLSPHVLSPTVVQMTCEMLLGMTLKDSAAELLICKNDWIEVLFVLAQVSFDHSGGRGESKTGEFLGSPAKDNSSVVVKVGEPMRKLADLLRCFRSLAYLPHVMGHLRKGGDLDAALLWLKEEDLPVVTALSGIGRGVGQGGRYIPPPVASSSYSAHFSTPQALALAPMQVSYVTTPTLLTFTTYIFYTSYVSYIVQLRSQTHSPSSRPPYASTVPPPTHRLLGKRLLHCPTAPPVFPLSFEEDHQALAVEIAVAVV